MENKTTVSEFLLHGFPNTEELRIIHIVVFLIIYLVALIENLIVVIVIVYSHQLHSPMYFFLVNLSLQDLGSISVTVPKSMMNSLMNTEAISYSGCLCQVFFLIFFMLSHFFLLGVMAYDRYVAICNPLHYEMVMNKKACIQMATSVWMGALFYSMLHMGNLVTLKYCSRIINQFFCEIPQLLKISCSKFYVAVEHALIFASSLGFVYYGLIAFSYVQIFRTVLRIPSTQGKQKAFSTCLPHFIVICLFMVSGTFAYMRPTSSSPSISDNLISMFYCVMPPVMNPLVYSIRNKELKVAFWKLILCFPRHTLQKFVFQICVF
ncbi:olfactory receptor 14A16-like [Protobothrops mucrosquamatus]|uniref:olfactory receptor 14A16-like n=1 Tax=Protobothrops mucrosquamatus TaxID=103944 RepID=UPI0010FB5EC4|nr:olfactory receptor 14A16-like [Protobothrops mucrosquamatus]